MFCLLYSIVEGSKSNKVGSLINVRVLAAHVDRWGGRDQSIGMSAGQAGWGAGRLGGRGAEGERGWVGQLRLLGKPTVWAWWSSAAHAYWMLSVVNIHGRFV